MRCTVGVMVLATGCSFAAVQGPPPALPHDRALDCTSSPAVPILDGVVAAAAATAGIAVADQAGPYGWARLAQTDEAVLLFGLGSAVAVSAITGAIRVRRCRSAERERAELGIVTPSADLARDLARDGELAAERGDCGVAAAIAAQLRPLDATAYATYMRDIGVAQCVQFAAP